MASRKSFLSKPNYIFPATSERQSQEGVLELEEAELWNSYSSAEGNKKNLPSSGSRSVLKRGSRKKVDGGGGRVTPASLPVNIPDWSKILKDDYKEHPKWDTDADADADDDDEEHEQDLADDHHGRGIRVPPHEYLARTRGASLSVHEGIGRTLKGRDLRSVRNAIWKKVGFED